MALPNHTDDPRHFDIGFVVSLESRSRLLPPHADLSIAEVRVNGVPHQAATQALAALPWPEVTAPTIARFYAVAVHPS